MSRCKHGNYADECNQCAFEDGQRAAKHAFGGLKELLRRQHKALKLPRAKRDFDLKRNKARDQ